MDFAHWIAWLDWNPPREAFTVPLIDRPVFWYGILFVSGFILSYFIINPILARFLKQTRRLSSIDILNWPQLIEILKNSPSPLIPNLNIPDSLALSPELKQTIMDGLNDYLKQPSATRQDLQAIFGKALATPEQTAYFLTDRLCWFAVAGTLIGARLAAVFFYDWPLYREHPIEIFKVWHGGLASHGGVVGVMIALYLYLKYVQKWVPQLTFLRLLDFVAIPSALVACFIRLGNFMNQEILGTPTSVPWAVIFGHPADGSKPIPRHPVQLYEAAAYLITFVILWKMWKHQKEGARPGAIVGLLFVLIFGSRFIFEFWKSTLDSIIDPSFLQIGQILSIPFILLGFYLLWQSKGANSSHF